MRRLRAMVRLAFLVSCVIFGVYIVKVKMIEDHTPPVITCKEDTVKISVQQDIDKQEEAILKGVKAKDNRDGDLTDSIRIASMSHFIKKGRRTVTYAVFDKANQVGTFERTVVYEDYESPKIIMKKPLRFSASEMGKANLTADMTVEDCLDGDLSSQLRTTLDDSYYNYEPGTYPVTVQVSNSAGDVRAVRVDLTIIDSEDRQEQEKQYPVLSQYIAYTSVGKKIKPKDYISGLQRGNTEYTYKEDGDFLTGTKKDIKITSNVDYDKPGTYTVEYSYRGEDGPAAVTKLYVVVEE